MKTADSSPRSVSPDWLDRSEYPFSSRFFQTDAGKMHYLDEGSGPPVVFVHGNPSWSFEYRQVIKELSKTHRCLAADHLGFGLSDKPLDWTYRPEDHARNLEALLESLDLKEITLVVGDWGGPIGLSYALNHPQRVSGLIITNTWMWSVDKDWYFRAFSGFVGGPLGRFLIRKRNFFAKDILGSTYGDKTKLTAEVHRHYLMPLENSLERKGNWTFPKEIIASSDWLQSLWDRRHVLKDAKILFAWGMKDIAFRPKELERWIEAFPSARVVRFPGEGHFLAEEKPSELVAAIRTLHHP